MTTGTLQCDIITPNGSTLTVTKPAKIDTINSNTGTTVAIQGLIQGWVADTNTWSYSSNVHIYKKEIILRNL